MGMELSPADDGLLRQSSSLLGEVAARHGVKSVQLGADPAELIVTMEDARTYFDLAEFELEAEKVLNRRVTVVSSRAPGAQPRETLVSSAPAA